MRDEYLRWLRDWFGARAQLPDGADEMNYFDAGWIDSFAVIELVEDLENAFHVRLGEHHFQDRRFVTLAGLAEMLDEMVQQG